MKQQNKNTSVLRTFGSKTVQAVAFAACLAAAASSQAGIGTLFESARIDGTFGAYGLDNGSISESFILTHDSTITSVTAGIWSEPLYPVTAIGWAFGTQEFGTSLGQGLSATTNVVVSNIFGLIDVTASTFNIAPLSLTAGTYFLTFTQANTAAGANTAYLDVTLDGGNFASVYTPGNTGIGVSFAIQGSLLSAPVPESSVLSLLCVGLACLALTGRSFKR